MAKTNKWADIGTLRTREFKDDDGNTHQIPYLVIDKSVKILKGSWDEDSKDFTNFTEVDLGDYRTVKCTDPTVSPQALKDGGYINQDEFNKRMQYIEDKNIKKKLTIAPSD